MGKNKEKDINPDAGLGKSPSLPAYKIRKSTKAKRIILRIIPGKGLEVVIPAQANPALVPDIIGRHREWINQKLSALQNNPGKAETVPPAQFLLRGGIERIDIKLSGELLFSRPEEAVESAQEKKDDCISSGSIKLQVISPQLLLTPRHNPANPQAFLILEKIFDQNPATEMQQATRSEIKNAAAIQIKIIFRQLREWVRMEAKRRLYAKLTELATKHNFQYSKCGVRFQKSRWGSCSGRKNISLNACLIFLPDSLCEYILLHELCHTREMNHSEAFWKELFAVDQEALAHDKAMRSAWRHVPFWVLD